MLFNSATFLMFFPFVSLVYFLIPHRVRWAWLLLSSYVFYMSWNPKYAILLATSTLITYASGILIAKANELRDREKATRMKKTWVALSLLSNLGILVLFKYIDFFGTNLIRLSLWLDLAIPIPNFNILLPIGISFYTFKALSYTIDVYRNDVEPETHLGRYALFVSFFPQLVAGPIEKSKTFLHQFQEEHFFDYTRVRDGLLLMLWGFFQKVVVADRLAILVNTVYNDPASYRGFAIVIATVFFALQIYCDFNSYSDIARGCAQVMGFRSSRNFGQPYLSRSIREFWANWHITLCSWFKDYLYIPLGGNRCSKLRSYFNIFVVFVVSGIWHGATINFLIWGGLHGLYRVGEDLLRPLKDKLVRLLNIRTETLSMNLFQGFLTFSLVCFAWIFFRANTFSEAVLLLNNMLYFNPEIFTRGLIFELGLDWKEFIVALLGIFIIILGNIMQRTKRFGFDISEYHIGFRWTIYVTAIVFILVFGIYGPDFDAQQFIYLQF
ncbi:MAG: alginate O-acetyltransferase [Gracilibacter sp. BRH_c7a]|nr:MAG: alginate O-acetyltransferase [Gracilibacter sp. BRH_c7a]